MLAFATAAPCKAQIVKYGECAIDLELMTLPGCALESRNGHLYVLRRFAVDVLSSRVSGVAAVPVSVGGHRLAWTALPDAGWAYFDRSGLVVVENVATMDNAADEFHNGLVRINVGNKWGLASLHGKVIAPLTFDGVLDVSGDHGWLACKGCRTVNDGEHSWFEGGEWFRLDRKGRVVGTATDPTAKKVP